MLEESVVDFYDPRLKRLFVRWMAGREGPVAPSAPEDGLVLVHEIVHALQDQHFDLARGEGLPDDEGLAYSALVEGDAVLSAHAVQAFDRGDLDRWIAHAVAQPRASAEEMVGKPESAGPEASRAPALLRRRHFFPYLEGTAFAVALHRSGGFERIDAAFARPPRSTEQVLHVEKYLAGEQPVTVEWPRPPVLRAIVDPLARRSSETTRHCFRYELVSRRMLAAERPTDICISRRSTASRSRQASNPKRSAVNSAAIAYARWLGVSPDWAVVYAQAKSGFAQ
ncbi:MAG: hypothetical protein JOZ69_10155 [Myxococcales bacterium]|nr:hypothetical protein [Myxococcales bacterium]